MKKNIKVILKNITPETSIEETISYCNKIEDFEAIIVNLPEMKSKPVLLSKEIKQAALSLVKTNELNAAQITSAFIQKNMPVSYPKAAAIVDWLKTYL